jgi:hypothetical protein
LISELFSGLRPDVVAAIIQKLLATQVKVRAPAENFGVHPDHTQSFQPPGRFVSEIPRPRTRSHPAPLIMGNSSSTAAGTNSQSIEDWYAARAGESRAINRQATDARNHDEAIALLSDWREIASRGDENAQDDDAGEAEGLATGADEDESTDSASSSERSSMSSGPPANSHTLDTIRDAIVPNSAFQAATCHLVIAYRAFKLGVHDTLELAIAALKKIDVVAVAKASLEWIKAHPYETAAVVIPLILLACTPAILGLVGFTAGGVAAGMIKDLVQTCPPD